MARRLRRAVEPEHGRSAHDGDVARRHTAQPRPATGQLQGARARRVADEAIGQGEGHAIGGGRVRHTERGHLPPATVLYDGAQPGATTSSTQRAAAGGRPVR